MTKPRSGPRLILRKYFSDIHSALLFLELHAYIQTPPFLACSAKIVPKVSAYARSTSGERFARTRIQDRAKLTKVAQCKYESKQLHTAVQQTADVSEPIRRELLTLQQQRERHKDAIFRNVSLQMFEDHRLIPAHSCRSACQSRSNIFMIDQATNQS